MGRIMTGEFTPLISVPLSCAAPRILILLCFSFFFCARGRLRACDTQDTIKQTGAFSFPLFLYIYSGRGVAIVLSIAARFTCDCGRDSRPRVLNVMFMFCARLSSHHALIVDKHILIIPASKMQRFLPVKKCQDPSHASKMQRLSPVKTRR